jgi:hypothetical protein
LFRGWTETQPIRSVFCDCARAPTRMPLSRRQQV